MFLFIFEQVAFVQHHELSQLTPGYDCSYGIGFETKRFTREEASYYGHIGAEKCEIRMLNYGYKLKWCACYARVKIESFRDRWIDLWNNLEIL